MGVKWRFDTCSELEECAAMLGEGMEFSHLISNIDIPTYHAINR